MKALASDFDGTLYCDGQIKEMDSKAIASFQKHSLFGMCTGRPIKHMYWFLNGKVECDFYITSTGSYILDKNGNVIYESAIPFEVAYEIVKVFNEKYQMYLHVGKEDIYVIQKEIEKLHSHQIIVDYDTLPQEHILDISTFTDCQQDAVQIQKEIEEAFGKWVDVYRNGLYVDVVNKGVSKGKACHWIKDYFHLDCLCGIGDNYNDIPMLDACDQSFSFVYSPQEVKDHSHHVVESVYDAIQIIEQKV